ncbi:MAG: preprotein translocase subunit SecG [Candidatus Pacebacteria bacterium]|nr:preprotein translocase subunit SecG [Candidatus Paceibacterota bacterium]
MKSIIAIAQLVVSVVLIVLVLLQERGGGMSEALGGSEGGFTQQRRGWEKTLFVITVVCVALFAITSLVILLL